jgi:hypothetical protein
MDAIEAVNYEDASSRLSIVTLPRLAGQASPARREIPLDSEDRR